MARITKQQASDASCKMANDIYDKKIDKADKEVKAYAKKLFEKYVPKPVIAVAQEFPEWFSWYNTIHWRNKDNYSRWADLPDSINPIEDKKLPLTSEEMKKIDGLKDALSEIKAQKSKFEDDIYNALITLQTEKRIKETLPDALPYINFSGSTALVPQYNELNTILKTLNKKQNENT